MIWNWGVEWIKGWCVVEIVGCYFLMFYLVEDIVDGRFVVDLVCVYVEGWVEEESW